MIEAGDDGTVDTLTRNPSPSLKIGVTHLALSALALTHFRNYTSQRIGVAPGPIVLTGRNGAGKTNILEAISLLTPGKGIRRAALSEMDNSKEGEPWTVAAMLDGIHGEVKIGTGRDPEAQIDKRLVKIDGKPKAQSELSRHLSVLWLTPQTEQLFHEGASAGRKFLDRLVYSFDPEHASRVAEYEYAMRERNRLLQTGQMDDTWLSSLERTMAETTSAIAAARLLAAEHINQTISSSHLSFPKAEIGIHGVAEGYLQAGKPAVAVEEKLVGIWAQSRSQDAAAGRTLVGAHRSELEVINVEKELKAALCSTGEQKALLLSVILAQARSGASWKGVVPVLLLDEIAAHLDSVRRLELFEEICQIGAQTWMTGTDALLFAELKGKAQYLQVDNGKVS